MPTVVDAPSCDTVSSTCAEEENATATPNRRSGQGLELLYDCKSDGRVVDSAAVANDLAPLRIKVTKSFDDEMRDALNEELSPNQIVTLRIESGEHGIHFKELHDGTTVVRHIMEGSTAWRDQLLGVGMRLCSIAGVSTAYMSHEDVLKLINRTQRRCNGAVTLSFDTRRADILATTTSSVAESDAYTACSGEDSAELPSAQLLAWAERTTSRSTTSSVCSRPCQPPPSATSSATTSDGRVHSWSPLPRPWKAAYCVRNGKQVVYFYNKETKERTWSRPTEDQAKQKQSTAGRELAARPVSVVRSLARLQEAGAPRDCGWMERRESVSSGPGTEVDEPDSMPNLRLLHSDASASQQRSGRLSPELNRFLADAAKYNLQNGLAV